jgi:hypothetical protein
MPFVTVTYTIYPDHSIIKTSGIKHPGKACMTFACTSQRQKNQSLVGGDIKL